jgi:hypothetical protein
MKDLKKNRHGFASPFQVTNLHEKASVLIPQILKTDEICEI